jgi:hypothetical protein
MAPENNGKLEMGQGWHCPYVQAKIARRQKVIILNGSQGSTLGFLANSEKPGFFA